MGQGQGQGRITSGAKQMCPVYSTVLNDEDRSDLVFLVVSRGRADETAESPHSPHPLSSASERHDSAHEKRRDTTTRVR